MLKATNGIKPRLRFLVGIALLVFWLLACQMSVVPTAIASPVPQVPTASLLPSATIPSLPSPIPSFSPLPVASATVTVALPFTPVQSPVPPVRFAVIGDYGAGGPPEAQVAALVANWNPDFVITVGDNNYPSGSAASIDDNIGQFYHSFIEPYKGNYGNGAEQNRFFPTLGNHDWDTPGAKPYLNYFTLPGNERYYDFFWGPLQFFAVDSDSREPDGVSSSSPQAAWLQERLASSTAPWKIVYFHHAPYSSGTHGPTTWMQWPFKEWGASVVLSGHDHTYERLEIDGLPYIIDGIGGNGRYEFQHDMPGSQVRYNENYGALLVEATPDQITFQFFNVAGKLIDTLQLKK